MKKIRCPKCDEAIQFDESQYEAGRILVFACPACNKQFKVRMPQRKNEESGIRNEECAKSDVPAQPNDHSSLSTASSAPIGHVVVIENAFHFRQEIPLYEGENVIGRFVKGTRANAAFKTVDPSVDTTHCIITATAGTPPTFTLRDAPSNTGTFLHDLLLRGRERVQIEDGAVITLGATTLILRTEEERI